MTLKMINQPGPAYGIYPWKNFDNCKW